MFKLREFRKLKKQYELRDFEWMFIACLDGGAELVAAEGPEAALAKSIDRSFMKEDVENALSTISQRTVALMRRTLLEGKSMREAGAEWEISAERVRVLLVRDFRRMRTVDRQSRLTGLYRQREEEMQRSQYRLLDNEPLGMLGLSVRAYNCLCRARIFTYHDFREWCKQKDCQSENQLMGKMLRIRNLGYRYSEEVIAKMKEFGWLDFLEE